MTKFIKASLSVISLGALASCGLTPNGPNQSLSVAEAHPITVDQQAAVLRVAIDPSKSGLTRGELSGIDAFVSAYRTRGHGPITVTAPVGGASDRAAQQTAADVRAALFAAGVPYEQMMGSSVRTAGDGDVVVSFQSYVATGPACGNASGQTERRLRQLRSADFGCASQANLAAMIADPRDLHAGVAPDGSGSATLVTAIETKANTPTEVVTYELDDE